MIPHDSKLLGALEPQEMVFKLRPRSTMPTSARRAFFESMMVHGFTMLRLHKVDANGVCRCWKGKDCDRPGRHFEANRNWKSVISTVDELEEHMDGGGSVGLSLWYQDGRIPQSPGRLVVFDCDEAAAEPWLRKQGITSPMMVTSKRGVHIYCRMPADVPELKSDTSTLQNPRIDIKVSGLVIAPWSPDKRLHINGQDVTDDPEAVLAFFRDFDQLMAALPEVDPRKLVPDMTERNPKASVSPVAKAAPSPVGVGASIAISNSAPTGSEPPKRIKFSDQRPVNFYAGYQGLQYNRRKTNAASHVAKLQPSIPGKKPHEKLVTAACDCIIHYGMSDQDTWEIIRDHFNPRCKDRQGKPYPWLKNQVAWAIEIAHQPEAYSMLDRIRGQVDLSSALAHERARGQRANARRTARNAAARDRVYESIRLFISTFYEVDVAGCLTFSELLDAVNKSLELDEQLPVKPHRLGKLLAADGIRSSKGTVGLKAKKVCDEPSTCRYALRYMVCPAAYQCLYY